jgi:hypothetical protein
VSFQCSLYDKAVLRPLADEQTEKYKDTMGPGASIIFPADWDEGREREIQAVLQSLGSVRESGDPERSLAGHIETTTPIGGTYAGERRPFGIQFVSSQGMRNDEDRSAEWCAHIKQEFGLIPQAELVASMDCNDREDHRVLGELCLYLARRGRGLVDFNSALMPPLAPQVQVRRLMAANWSDVSEPTERLLSALPARSWRYRIKRQMVVNG